MTKMKSFRERLKEHKKRIKKTKVEKKSYFNLFKIKKEKPISIKLNLSPIIKELPEIKDIENFSYKYPLIFPMAYAHIYFNDELIYEVIEPKLTKIQKEHLEMLKKKLIETIDTDLSEKEVEDAKEYLFKRATKILEELNYKLHSQEYKNI